jgi:hypothetical protein
MQQCRVRGVRSVELAVTNLEEAGRFYESVWALRPVEARDGVQLYRGPRLIIISSACIAGRGRARAHRVRCGRPRRRRRASPRDLDGGRAGHRAGGLPPTAAAMASAAWIRTGATSPSCARAPTTRTHRTCRPAAPDRPRQSQRPELRRQLSLSSPRRSAFDRSTRTLRCGFCIATPPSTAPSCSPRPALRRSITSPSRCRTSIPSCAHGPDEGERLSDRVGAGPARAR